MTELLVLLIMYMVIIGIAVLGLRISYHFKWKHFVKTQCRLFDRELKARGLDV